MKKPISDKFFLQIKIIKSKCLSDTNWEDYDYPSCGGDRQSPVDIDSDDVFPADYSDFKFSLNYKILQKGMIENNGHSRKTYLEIDE